MVGVLQDKVTGALELSLDIGEELVVQFFASEFEFFEPGGRQLEYMTKDTVKVAGVPLNSFSDAGGKDAHLDLGAQTHNGLSVRALMTMLVFIKAAAYFRGADEVEFEDVRQVLPFVLHDKLAQNRDAAFFDQGDNGALRADQVSWIRGLFDSACQTYDRLSRDSDDKVSQLMEELEAGLEGLEMRDVDQRLDAIERQLRSLESGGKLYGHMFDDIISLKYMHQRYTNYRAWLRSRA